MSEMKQVDILLVEDNSRDAELAIRALKEHNLANNLLWLKNGADALDFIFGRNSKEGTQVHRQPKVVLLDLKMPKVDGLEVLRQIKSDPKTKSIPVVVLTSSRQTSDFVESYMLGANSYIVKPVSFENFSDAIAQLGQYWLSLNQLPITSSIRLQPTCQPLNLPHNRRQDRNHRISPHPTA